jgi:OFA family oxalate/formate antiporter-like MFS transporter
MLASPIFWILYVMFVMVSASGLMATAQIAPIAKDFDVANTIIFFGATTLTAALIIDSVAKRCGSAAVRLGFRQHRP